MAFAHTTRMVFAPLPVSVFLLPLSPLLSLSLERTCVVCVWSLGRNFGDVVRCFKPCGMHARQTSLHTVVEMLVSHCCHHLCCILGAPLNASAKRQPVFWGACCFRTVVRVFFHYQFYTPPSSGRFGFVVTLNGNTHTVVPFCMPSFYAPRTARHFST